MVMHRCDDFRSTYSGYGEEVHANSSSEVTRYSTKSCGYKAFALTRQSNGTRFVENVSDNPSTDLLTIPFVAIGKKPRRHHEQGNPNLTHNIMSLIGWVSNLGLLR